MLVKARIVQWTGGRYGTPGEYVAVVRPKFFKNGKVKKTGFEVVKKLETLKNGYVNPNAAVTENIAEVLEYIDE